MPTPQRINDLRLAELGRRRPPPPEPDRRPPGPAPWWPDIQGGKWTPAQLEWATEVDRLRAEVDPNYPPCHRMSGPVVSGDAHVYGAPLGVKADPSLAPEGWPKSLLDEEKERQERGGVEERKDA